MTTTPPDVDQDVPTRVLLFTGKGGVGKTTVAAATAVHAAATGASVLVTSTDPAHSLGDVFGRNLGDRATSVAPNVDAVQLDSHQRLEAHWADVRDWLVEVLVAGGADRMQAGELVVLPGMDELFALLDVLHHVEQGRHDVVVVDCAPTAETLRLLALPEALAFYSDRLFTPGRRLARLVRPVTRSVAGVPLPDDEVFTTVDRVQHQLSRVHDLLCDARRTSVRLVLTPQRVVLAESMRTMTALALFGHAVDSVIVNRVAGDDASPATRGAQAAVLDEVEAAFAPWDLRHVGARAAEPIGPEALGELGRDLWGDTDPRDRLSAGPGIHIEAGQDVAVVTMPLPFVDRGDVDLHRRGRHLHVRVGGVKRVLALPDSLAHHAVVGARVRDDALVVRLAPTAAARADLAS